jgi:hypothetical protein
MRHPSWAIFVCGVAILGSPTIARSQVTLVDVTSAAGVAMNHVPNAGMIPGINEWITSGLAVGDFNRDGWPDLFVIRGGTGYDRLFINQGNGTFLDRAATWGVAAAHGGCGAAVGDVDGDRWPDVYVASYGSGSDNAGQLGKNRLYRNNGNGSFSEIATTAGVAFTSQVASAGNGPAWGDYDLDGDLDLAVAAWSATAAGNRIFRNDGGQFTDVTGVAVPMPSATWGFQASFADLDGDRYPEILWAADFGTSRLFRNDRNGAFSDVTVASGVGLDENGMGQCVGDFDGDGDLDWFVTSIFSDRPPAKGLNGNVLYRNDGGLAFTEVAAVAGVADGGWGWGAQAVDLDHDGRLDIIEVNGRTAGQWLDEPEYVYRNLGNGTFLRDAAAAAPLLARDGRSVVTLDYDRDGDLDVAIGYNAGPLKLYRNDAPAGRKWLTVSIDVPPGSRVPSFGLGTRVEVTTIESGTTVTRIRTIDGGPGYLGSSEPIAHFGLGNAVAIVSVRIRWPRGHDTVLGGVELNRRLMVEAPVVADLDADGTVGPADLSALLAGWGPVDPLARFLDLNDDGEIGAADLAGILSSWDP